MFRGLRLSGGATAGSDRGRIAPASNAGVDVGALTADQLVDLVLDREAPAHQMDEILRRIASDPGAARRLAAMQSVFDTLRTPQRTPNLVGAVIAEVGARRRWLAPALQRTVTAGRLAIAAALLVALAAGLIVQRVSPEAPLFGNNRPTPLAGVFEASHAETTAGIRNVAEMFSVARWSAASARPVGAERFVFLGPNTLAAPPEGMVKFEFRAIVSGDGEAVRVAPASADLMLVDPTGRERVFVVQLRSGVECDRKESESRWVVLPRER